MPKKKSNWDLIRGQKDTETVKYRDVYEDQQLERGSIAEKQTMTSRFILSGVAAILAAVLVWTLVSAIQMFTQRAGLDDDADPSDDWIHVSEYYYDVNDTSKVLSVDEYNKWYETYHAYDAQRSDTDNPPDVPIDDLAEFARSFSYDDGVYSKDYVDYSVSDYQQMVFAHGEEYKTKLDEYTLYYYRHTDPEYHDGENGSAGTGYKKIAAHYKNINDFSDVISEDAYKKLVSDYEKSSGQLSDDIKSIPLKPIDMSAIYEANDSKYMTYDEYWKYMGLDTTRIAPSVSKDQFDEFIAWCNQNGYDITSSPYTLNPISAPDMNDANASQQYARYQEFWNKLKELFASVLPSQSYKDCWNTFEEYCQEVHYDRSQQSYIAGTTITYAPQSYRNKLDGTIISVADREELVNKYEQDASAYQEMYTAHREKYHPDDIDGTKTVFTMRPNFVKLVLSLGIGGVLFGIMVAIFKKNLKAQNLMSDTSDINQYHNDQHVALPEEIQKNYDWFPDVGAHSAVQVSSMISHMAISNKGLKNVTIAKRADHDIKDNDGRIEYYKGEILLDDNGNPLTKSEPIIDTEFMEALFDASGAPKDKKIRHYYDTTKIPYNPGNGNRDKLQDKNKPYDTVADLINRDWDFPLYEPQRPAGAYIVDTAPVNTMVLAITRAGKGQTVIEPTLDMWMREKRPNNIVVNDPKGELLVKNYVRATVRGLQVVQFNLINAMKTDIYNPLALAADAAREGDNTKCAMYVENIAEVFFPTDGGEDPFWPNAANNAFKRAAYGLIDYYLEEEKAMRRMAERTGLDATVLEQRLDEMWGKVTLYNCYQLFVQLSSKKMKNPAVEFSNQAKAGKFNDLSDEEYKIQLEKVKEKSKLWEDKPEVDLLTLFFSATDALPRNSMRTLVGNANNALKAMGGSDKTISSVYGIAITAMSFFTDPTISTLTSGTPNQNVDLGSFSFPRRMGVRFNSEYMQINHFVGQQAVWDAYEDDGFTKCLGKMFHHDDTVSREGWARYFFDGKFQNEISYIKLEIRNPSTGSLIRTFYFKFKKSYQTSLDGRVYVKDPVLEEKIVKNGILTEMRKFRDKNTGEYVYKEAKTTFDQEKILDIANNGQKTKVKTNAIISMMARYAEKPKMTFLVTPPHLMKYAKLILILIKQLVDMNFDKSYMTKSNQKPLYKTRYMLDELGNLQSEGHGIAGFETMLSIGLGQEQQFTLILQTLQQLKDVYGVMILSTNRVAAHL